MSGQRAQSVIEYSVLLILIASVFMAMNAYLKRGIQAGIKVAADELGIQKEGLPEADEREGAVETSVSTNKTAAPTQRNESVSHGGRQEIGYSESRQGAVEGRSVRKDNGWYYVGNELRRKP